MKGKEKCKALKEIRRQIAAENDIPYVVSQCTYKGDCRGTCPRCEAELRYLERELAIRQALGKAVVVAGISAGVCTSLTACGPVDAVVNFIESRGHTELEGATSLPDDISGMMVEPEIGETERATPGGDVPSDTAAPEAGADNRETDMLAGEIMPVETDTPAP